MVESTLVYEIHKYGFPRRSTIQKLWNCEFLLPHVIKPNFIRPKMIQITPRNFSTYYLILYCHKNDPTINKTINNLFAVFLPLLAPFWGPSQESTARAVRSNPVSGFHSQQKNKHEFPCRGPTSMQLRFSIEPHYRPKNGIYRRKH